MSCKLEHGSLYFYIYIYRNVHFCLTFLFFFSQTKEIDAITTQPSSDEAASHSSLPTTDPPRPEVNNQQLAASQNQNQQGAEFEYNTHYSLAGGNCFVKIKSAAYVA